jgi:phage terminase small subunit
MSFSKRTTPRAKRPLNPRQRRFKDEYLRCLNATRAAIKAGYSEKTAYSIGGRLLKNVEIRKQIEQDMIESATSSGRVLRETSCIVEADPAEIFGEDGRLLHPNEMPESIRRAIASIKVNKGMIEVRFWSKTEAIGLMAKYRKLFIDRTEVTGKDGRDLLPVDKLRDMLFGGGSER